MNTYTITDEAIEGIAAQLAWSYGHSSGLDEVKIYHDEIESAIRARISPPFPPNGTTKTVIETNDAEPNDTENSG